jgi:hypothetical protein
LTTIAATTNAEGAPDDAVRAITWAGLATSGDIGDTQSLPAYSEKTFTATGTFTGAPTVALQGSNDGTNWFPLTNKQGTAITFTAGGMQTSQDRPLYVRPTLTAGTGGASITIICAAHKFSLPGRF